MDTQTLLAINALFFCLYASMALISQRAFRGLIPGMRGSRWFAAASISLAAAAVLLMAPTSGVHPITQSISWLAVAAGAALLHRSFAELVSRGTALWDAQLAVVAAVLLGVVSLVWMPSLMPSVRIVSEGLWALQCLMTVVVLIRACTPETRFPGWFTAAVFLLCASSHLAFLWIVGALHLRTDLVLLKGLLLLNLICNGAIAFGFMLLMMSRMRITLEREADADELTGLLNRRALRKVAARVMARSRRLHRPMAVIMVDLDDFKGVNDRLGHAAGDTILCAVAGALEGAVRKGDKVARVGGDEFCLLLPQTASAEAMRVAARCRAALGDIVIPCGGSTVRIGGSIGVGHSSDGRLSWKRLLAQSDAALYEAKRSGKNRVALAIAEAPQSRFRMHDDETQPIRERPALSRRSA